MVPVYRKLRFARAEDLAKHWLSVIGHALKKMVKAEALKNFINSIESGHRLSSQEISLLNTIHKGEYIKLMLQEDDKGNNYLNSVQNKCLDMHD